MSKMNILINGKQRATLDNVPESLDDTQLKAMILAEPAIAAALKGKVVVRVVFSGYVLANVVTQ